MEKIQVINLTPHPVVLQLDGAKLEFPSNGALRVKTRDVSFELPGGLPCVRQEFLPVFELNDRQITLDELAEEFAPAILIVSVPVLEAVKALRDGHNSFKGLIFVRPDTSPASAIRDEQGRIIAVRRFAV